MSSREKTQPKKHLEINPLPAVFSNAEQFELHSEKIGEEYLIQVGLPGSYATGDRHYPVVYALDGNLFFGMYNDTIRLLQMDMIEPGIPELIVVSIGYVKAAQCGFLRNRDYTPKGSVPDSFFQYFDSKLESESFKHLEIVKVEPGGADNFLKFIEHTLDPVIRQNYRVDDNKASILGDSFGGLFTYYAFLKQSPLFDKYWIGSPGLLQEDCKLVEELPGLLLDTDFDGQRVYISLGEGELSHSFYGTMGRNYTKITTHIKTTPGKNLSAKCDVHPGQTHASVVPAALMQAIRFLYSEN
ncbi:alpha/beta hydrolase [Pseudomaricurvus alkylphenolicus]|uniref:alpha/beta hydrolase n=1 Tax=Pseudomaricurvus alkylphenolicus TaxID=1306991 RepID=UPI0014248C38|nr:alpha/beta hydrolase-fold protein [Pseudomaricurvus alkylphenolicus]NIB38182.1 alpha/beta hydrolase [Pseudomaricurvus alkylphenolicus]